MTGTGTLVDGVRATSAVVSDTYVKMEVGGFFPQALDVTDTLLTSCTTIGTGEGFILRGESIANGCLSLGSAGNAVTPMSQIYGNNL